MFNLKQNEINNKIFYLKDLYEAEETFNYTLSVFNHISKTGFTLDMTDISPFVSGITNNSTLNISGKTIFYSGETHYINADSNLTFVFNNKIQISGVNYTFNSGVSITDTKFCKLNNNYVIVFNENAGKLVLVNSGGTILSGITFCNTQVSNLNIIPISTNKVVVGYYDVVLGISFLKEISVLNTLITPYTPTMFYIGRASNLKINKIDDDDFVLTYQTSTQGIIQVVKLSIDHIFSVKYPFFFNDDVTLFSNSIYVSGNVVVIYYDLDDQLKVRNCKLYADYIGVELPQIIKNYYCYDLGIGKLDDNYVYITYYDGEDMVIYTSLLRIDDDITIIQNEVSISDWSEGLYLTTITDKRYMVSYMDSGYTGVYRYIDVTGGTFTDIIADYNEFNIDLQYVDLTKNGGHNDYSIIYNNEIVEQGICFIDTYTITYNT